MRAWDLGQIHKRMEVWDITGEPVGRIAQVYGPASAMSKVDPRGASDHESILEVNTDPLSIGMRYLVPESGIFDVNAGVVVLAVSRRTLAKLGWLVKQS